MKEEEGQENVPVCRASDLGAGLSIMGERQDFTEIESTTVATILLGGGRDGEI